MAHPTARGEQARAEILEAAKHLFLHYGYGATSMRDIAKAAGNRAVAGIYNHFPTKQAIFQALLETHNPFDEIIAVVESGSGETGPKVFANVMRELMLRLPNYVDFIDLAQIDLREFQGEYIIQISEAHRTAVRVLQAVERAQKLPGLKPMNRIVLMELAANFIFGYALGRRFTPPYLKAHLPEDVWIEQFIEAFLTGVAE
ncbi:MAG TPA: helix-turn-helix domain-containing protein [Phototrophicaceae bacterium]|nr:helix-turn-helix domain-containing protein [Phototrophicaceae bacterium]